mmetsp:Transcript_6011/g.17210  ORF Transcript_6011/g.17210 Transcript_6011/m.17210 type:complete len:201 (+) Transcript_6011:1666-2268(+)
MPVAAKPLGTCPQHSCPRACNASSQPISHRQSQHSGASVPSGKLPPAGRGLCASWQMGRWQRACSGGAPLCSHHFGLHHAQTPQHRIQPRPWSRGKLLTHSTRPRCVRGCPQLRATALGGEDLHHRPPRQHRPSRTLRLTHTPAQPHRGSATARHMGPSRGRDPTTTRGPCSAPHHQRWQQHCADGERKHAGHVQHASHR